MENSERREHCSESRWRAAGGEFETDNLFTHILVWTNYYPSLIQLYGAELVQYLRDAAGRPFPYSVNMDDIKAVFAKDGLRDYIPPTLFANTAARSPI